jgi:phosphotransferase system enzyme I (PtsI)
MSFVIHGIGVSGGIAIGHAQLMAHAALEVPHCEVARNRIDAEVARFDRAMDETHTELQALIDKLPVNAPPEYAAFVQLHLMILNDPTLAEEPRVRIREQHCNAEWALQAADGHRWWPSSRRSRTPTCASGGPTSSRWWNACSRA